MQRFFQLLRRLTKEQKGITGLETCIVLIAFVVVSSVFAFAALSTGLFVTDPAKVSLSEAQKLQEGLAAPVPAPCGDTPK